MRFTRIRPNTWLAVLDPLDATLLVIDGIYTGRMGKLWEAVSREMRRGLA
jgi:hypothetical protein